MFSEECDSLGYRDDNVLLGSMGLGDVVHDNSVDRWMDLRKARSTFWIRKLRFYPMNVLLFESGYPTVAGSDP